MNDYNFNQLKNIKTPEEWMQKALNIPSKKKIPLIFSYKTYAFAAAVFVCVCAVTVAATMNFNSNTVVKISPTSNNSTTQTHNNTLPIFTAETNSTEQTDTTANFTDDEFYNSETITLFPQTTYNTTISGNTIYPTTSVLRPSQALLPTQGNGGAIQNSTSRPTEHNTKPIVPTFTPATNLPIVTVPPTYIQPTQVVTEPPEYPAPDSTIVGLPSAPCVKPTESTAKPPICTNVVTEPQEETTFETSPQYTAYYNIYFQLQSESNFNMNNTLYCHIIDKNGHSLFKKFSENEKCNVYSQSSKKFVYNINILKNPLPNGTYTFIFYDEYDNSSVHNVVIGFEKTINLYE